MKRVGIVVSYSSTEMPYERSRTWSSVFSGSMKSTSNRSLSFRVSHQMICPSAPPEKNSVPVLLLTQRTELTLSRWQTSRGVVETGRTPVRVSQAQHWPVTWPLARVVVSFWWNSMHVDALVGESVKSGRLGFSISQTNELFDALVMPCWKSVLQYVTASLEPPSGDHDKWLIGRWNREKWVECLGEIKRRVGLKFQLTDKKVKPRGENFLLDWSLYVTLYRLSPGAIYKRRHRVNWTWPKLVLVQNWKQNFFWFKTGKYSNFSRNVIYEQPFNYTWYFRILVDKNGAWSAAVDNGRWF